MAVEALLAAVAVGASCPRADSLLWRPVASLPGRARPRQTTCRCCLCGGGAADRLQIGTIQTDFKIFGRQKWPTIQITYKNGTIHITYTSPLYKLTTVPHGQGVYCNHSEYAPHFKKYPEHSPTNNNYFFAFIIEM